MTLERLVSVRPFASAATREKLADLSAMSASITPRAPTSVTQHKENVH